MNRELATAPPRERGAVVLDTPERSLVDVAVARVSGTASDFGRTRAGRWWTRPLEIARWRAALAAGLLIISAYHLGTEQAPMSGGAAPKPIVPMPPAALVARFRPHRDLVTPTMPSDASASSFVAPTVIGIVGRLPGNAVVLIKHGGRAEALAIGSDYDGWRLIELSATSAVFSRDGARRTMELPATE